MAPEQFVDVHLSEQEFEQRAAIATGAENLGDLVEVAGLDGRSVADLLASKSSEERRTLTTILGGGSADDRAGEWGRVSDGLDRTVAEINRVTSVAKRMIDDAILSASAERLDALLTDVATLLAAQGGFFLAHSWMSVARLADAPRATIAYMATVLDSASERVNDLHSRIVLLRNANRDVPAHLIMLDAKQISDDDLADLVRTLTSAQSAGPANDVVEAERPAAVGYGVFFGESLAVWLPTDERSPEAVATMAAVVAWVQRRHDERMMKPRYLTFYSRLGFLLRTVKWEPRTCEPVVTEGGETGRPAPRPDTR